MNKKEQEQRLTDFHIKMKQIVLSKGDDYANEDRLSNFKQVASITGVSPEMVALVMIATKVARLANLIDKTDNPNHESIRDSKIDLANYAFLMDCLEVDRSEKVPYLGTRYEWGTPKAECDHFIGLVESSDGFMCNKCGKYVIPHKS